MTEHNNGQKKITSKTIWILVLFVLLLLAGGLTTVMGVNNIENYDSPYWFGFVFGSAGLAFGIGTSKILKPYIAVNRQMKNDYWRPTMFISIGFIGVFILIGSLLNRRLSTVINCDKFLVINKSRREARFRQPELNNLFVIINGENRRLSCSHDYWNETLIEQPINLCMHRSSIGFDYISLTDDKYYDK